MARLCCRTGSSPAVRQATHVTRLSRCTLLKSPSFLWAFFLFWRNIVFSFVTERKNPLIGSFIECEGVRLHYLERGDPAAPSVVLFHGNGSLIQDLIISGLVDRLARHNRVLCFDRPGFGYSQRPRARIWTATSQAALFVKALNQLGVREPIVLGHSWGALVAVAIGFQDNYPLRGLVLASGYYFRRGSGTSG